jgi:hypothetical protein
MDTKKQIETLFTEAEVYKSHGLFVEAKEKYKLMETLIQKNDRIANRQYLLDTISKKIGEVENEIKKLVKPPATRKLSTKTQDLVKNLFSFSEEKDEDVALLEGAMALAKFGQFERALIEFNELIKNDSLRVSAAKNIIRCHSALSSLDNAVTKYQQWVSSDIFSSSQLEQVRAFLQGILDRKGIDETLPTVKKPTDATEEEEEEKKKKEEEKEETSEEEFLEICSIGIEQKKGTLLELDVHFQRGNMISLIIPAKDKEMIENLNLGVRLNDVQFYSPVAVFNASGIVSGKAQIKTGPKQGDYRLDIKIVGT